MPKDITLTIDGTTVTVPEGTLLVEAAKTIATDVPVYCYHPKLGPAGLCRICLVEVEKMPKLQIACNTAVAEGMAVHTYGEKVADGRRAVLEFLLLNHPLDCPICDKGGECDLQDFSMAYGQGASRLADPKSVKPKAIDLGPTIVLDDERCIVCQRCSRFDEIITAERSLVVKERGQRDVIATADGAPYVSSFSGNVTELCPVGALTSKTYRFKSRPWDLHRTETTCTQCGVGCAMRVDERHGEILRTMSVESDESRSDGWLCDRGRYNIGFYTSPERLTSPLLRVDGEWTQLDWDEAIELWARRLREALAEAGPAALGALGGADLLNEEAWLVQHVMRGLGSDNLDWRTGRQRQASAARYPGTYADLERARVIVTIGRPPSQTAPVMDLRIRKAVARHGARLISVGAHLAGSFVPETHAQSVGEIEALFGAAQRVAFVWDGIDFARGADAAALMERLAEKGVAVSAFVPGEFGNARGAEAAGLLPRSGGLDADGMLEAAGAGSLRVLSIFGANPVLHHPAGAEAVRDALAKVPFVVATGLFLTATSELATLLLPARGAFEKSGHTTALTGEILPLHEAHAAPAGTLAEGDMLIALAAELDLLVPDPFQLGELAKRGGAEVTGGFADEAFAPPPVAPAAAKSGELPVAIASHPFSGGGGVHADERLRELRPRPVARLSPATAAAAGVADGDLVDLVAGERIVRDLLVQIDDGAIDGPVTIVDGLPEAPANALADGEFAALANVRPARTLAGVTS